MNRLNMQGLPDLLRRLLPSACPGCGAQLGKERGLCQSCRAELCPRLEVYSPFQNQVEPHLVTLGPYRGIPRRAVRALKYGGHRDLALPLGQVLASGIPASWQISAVVPVPLHRARARQRGFNQAQLLAQVIATSLGVPCISALTRTRATAQQAKQQVTERAANLSGAFQVTAALPAGNLLLVDDVLTTGSTLAACRDALTAAGHHTLKYAVVAR